MTNNINYSSVKILEGDCREKLKEIKDSSVHMILTDPPYFLDGLDNDWKKGRINSVKGTGSVGGLPIGMKFDTKQGKALQKFMTPIVEELFRVLVPGGAFICFSCPRLYHCLAIAVEDSGFEIRDMYIWHFKNKAQFKAFSMNHFVRKMKISQSRKEEILDGLGGRKTPQLRPQFESILFAMKSKEGTFVDNWIKYGTGLIDVTKTLDGRTPTTLMHVEKVDKKEFKHLTVKPVRLLEHLIGLFTCGGQIVLDPFLGTGSTALAAIKMGRKCIGIEINSEYAKMAKRRIDNGF